MTATDSGTAPGGDRRGLGMRPTEEVPMGCGCLIALLVWLSPRFALVIMQLFTDKLSIAMDSFLMGALGLRVPAVHDGASTPSATRRSAASAASAGSWWRSGFLLDLGSWFGGGKQAQQRQAVLSALTPGRADGRPVGRSAVVSASGTSMPLAPGVMAGVSPGE